MNPQFYIASQANNPTAPCALAMQIGPNYFGYAVVAVQTQQLLSLGWYAATPQQPLPALDVLLQNDVLLNPDFEKVNIAFDFTSYTLLPTALNTGDTEVCMYLNGASQQDHVMHEPVREGVLSILYTLPYATLNSCISHFPGAAYWHVQTIGINNADYTAEQGCITVIIGVQDFRVVVTHARQLLLAQTYSYQSPPDVLFYLLTICHSFSLLPTTVQLILSGLIDQASALYKTLYDYFLHISLQNASWQMPDDRYPAHYFTTLNHIAVCESLQEL